MSGKRYRIFDNFIDIYLGSLISVELLIPYYLIVR